MKIIFLHPDLGIGGAERLVLDTALATKQLGHDVHFVTNHFNPNHCFNEVKDGTIEVTSVLNWFPRNFFGKFYALFAYYKLILAGLYLILFGDYNEKLADCDVIFVDLISAPIPFIKFCSLFKKNKPKIIFYCHFPDKKLTQRETFLKTIYRKPIDWFEEWTTGFADCILVNSKFTENVFRESFLSLNKMKVKVLYPTINTNSLDKPPKSDLSLSSLNLNKNVSSIYLSINRYERKKNIGLAIDALDNLLKKIKENKKNNNLPHLIIVGGYDQKNVENIEYYEELNEQVKKLNLTEHVTFLKSPDDEKKKLLIHSCTCVLYTPENEHFGIVPIEAMYLHRPVIACKSGGPIETIQDGKTGFLCEANHIDFSEKMLKFFIDKDLAREFGKDGHERVKRLFSFDKFLIDLNLIFVDLFRVKKEE